MGIQSETNLSQFRKSFKICLMFLLHVKLKLIPPTQINSFVFLNSVYFRKDCNARGGGLLFYVNEDRNCKVLNKYPTLQDLEIIILELKFSKTN